ncbi:MAG: transcription elongation factor GreA [Spirochaetes bacterium GWD1_61_31]|nr:MAG: transcription elongation factor GreA [Spirochaetes bacterium GWB1_60_80]OHD35109.1 MAG: transcription elongation factor GreA [Spirochaetes bacterium GWC1_61_12]OHD43628.1 MAG: transcription elongation factor GreA [Spirochaetes bacterium GWD1_61_31]OHD44120.1 MAG: transcription elongation factor GreA [Spirochaetes bacterium GWE1_60_18]OHD61839.1 MAG: transcription elongation factor GreA [Spirochaetes bacterium GWF1_60_12]HAW85097.1 transcription elongation factor GreA [Spirochaetaceae b
MADSLIAKKVQEMLNEEKWTRAALSGYTVNQIKELDHLFHEAAHEKILPDLKQLCDEHLGHSKNSIAGLYLSGIISLSQQQIDDSNMISLIEIFTDNRKWTIVEYICNRILDYGENRHALQYLAECYENEDRVDEMYAAWERLVRVDHEEADIVKQIAERKEKAGEIELAIDYYRKALHRYINKKLFSNAKEIWNKLIEFAPSDIDFFLHVQRKIAKQISEEKAAILLTDLYKHYKANADWDTAILLQKTILEYDDKNPQSRKELVECYKAKFSAHSHVDEYIRLSNLGQSYRNIHEAIADFEKHISFDSGNFVFHRTWNIGRIKEIKGDDITIDFAKKRDHHMSLKMAVESLTTLKKDHIWVLKAIWSKDKLYDKIKNDIPWALKTIITSFDNNADVKKIKTELVPSILAANEWTTWSSKARKMLKSDPIFGNTLNSVNTYIVRDRPLTYEEKIYNQFKADSNFFSRIQNLRDFLEKGDADSEFFNEMLGFFTSYVKSYAQVNEQVIASYLFLVEISSNYPQLKNLVSTSFMDLYNSCQDIVSVYINIKDSSLKAALLQHIKNLIPNWPEIYIKLFPWSLSQSMVDILLDAGEIDRLRAMIQYTADNYRDHRELFIWIVKNLWEEEWVKSIRLPYDKILLILIHILDITYKEIENHRDTTENKKFNKQVYNLLFRDKRLDDYLINEADRDTIERIYALIADIKDLDSALKLALRKKIQEKYADFKFNDEEKSMVSRGLMVTGRKYEEKNQMLGHILNVEVSANQAEIAYALSLGDLRENAEYKAAKEKQDELNAKVGKLKNEIERAQIFDTNNIATNKISFGTEVQLRNNLEKTDEIYIILGPWESDPTHHIISYLSPLGKRLLNHKTGETLDFIIHERKFSYTVTNIKAATFD